MTKWITVKKNGKRRAVPLGSPRKGYSRHLSQKELNDLNKIGIRHPGSLTSLGYHISEPAAAKHEALNRAVIGAIISTGEALGPFGLVIMVVGTTGSIGIFSELYPGVPESNCQCITVARIPDRRLLHLLGHPLPL